LLRNPFTKFMSLSNERAQWRVPIIHVLYQNRNSWKGQHMRGTSRRERCRARWKWIGASIFLSLEKWGINKNGDFFGEVLQNFGNPSLNVQPLLIQ
jgi:hypothetical protein